MKRAPTILAILALLAIVAYLPALAQPFIDDDYPNIQLANAYGSHGWSEMWSDPIFRVRATTHLLLYGLNRAFGMDSTPYYACMILLHVLNTWLVFALGFWSAIGYRVSMWAAGFFAVYEGHNEAIMWISGSTEPLLVLFGLIAFLCWLRFLDGRGWLWYLASIAAFGGALLSKESAVIWAPLLLLPVLLADRGNAASLHARLSARLAQATCTIPHAALAALAAVAILHTRAYSFRFSDGSFSWHAPFWITWPTSYGRLLWFWGGLAILAILISKPPKFARSLLIGLLWIGIALIPYSFLTYSTRIPSRQIHLASVGLALIVGFALHAIPNRTALALVCSLMILHNIGYLWTKKRAQFLERAQPIEQLLDFATAHHGAIYVKCWPRQQLSAEAALELMFPGRQKNDLVWNQADADSRRASVFCYMP